MMNRIMVLKKMGVAIHLHYFCYNERGMPNELNQFCEAIHVYKRNTGHKGYSSRLPYIVASRMNEELNNNLRQDGHPVLLEGLHCTGVLPQLDLSRRKVVVRMHNEESTYYRELARAESSLLKKLYFLRESRLIRKYNHQLPEQCTYACVSSDDIRVLREDCHLPHVQFIPTFPAWQQVTGETGAGNLCLYHGNLSVPENEKAAAWLPVKLEQLGQAPPEKEDLPPEPAPGLLPPPEAPPESPAENTSGATDQSGPTADDSQKP